jgi:F-type H+-transporting ATPase subunit b
MIRVLAIAALLLGLVPSAARAAEGGGGLINLDKSIVIQAINFLLLLLILGKLLYKPLLAKMEERTQAIRKSLEEAQAARADAQREREEHAAKLQAAYAEAQAIRATALKEAAEEQRRLVDGARAHPPVSRRPPRREGHRDREPGGVAVRKANLVRLCAGCQFAVERSELCSGGR